MNLTSFRPLYERQGPHASAYMDASHTAPDSAHQIQLRWRELRDDLASDRPASESKKDASAILAAMDAAIDDAAPAVGDSGVAVFAADGEVELMTTLPRPPARPSAEWSTYPQIAPLVRAWSTEARWMQVVVDRTGAILALPHHGHVAIRGSETFPMTKVAVGGWSQSRYQRAAETTWDRNASDVAAAVTATANRLGADVIVVAGDDRARELLMSRLPKAVASRVVPAETRAFEPGTEPRPLDEATAAAVAELVHARDAALLDRYRAGLAGAGAVTGLTDVTAAAREGQIGTLLISDEDTMHEVW